MLLVKNSENGNQTPYDLKNKSILVTGGTGSFGKKFVETILRDHQPNRIIVFSRDELKQYEMQNSKLDHPSLRYFVGDIRDKERLMRALRDVQVVVHAAALKQVPSCEYNPFEAIMTNVMGTRNVIEAAIDCKVERVLALSTDKAVNPVNLYGATKLCAEKLVVQGNAYSTRGGTKLSCVRYGNVMGSRGSVIPVFLKQRSSGKVSITDERMSRFWITLDQGVQLVVNAITNMEGGEIFIPKIPSTRVTDIAKAVAPNCKIDFVGIRPGEKIHELLIGEDEARQAVDLKSHYVILPAQASWRGPYQIGGEPLPEGFSYASNTNTHWLTIEEIRSQVEMFSNQIERRAVAA